MGTNILSPELRKEIDAGQHNGAQAGIGGMPVMVTDKRPLYWHKIPPALRDVANGVTRLGFVKLYVDEDYACIDRGQGNNIRIQAELAKESLRGVDVNGVKQKLGFFDATVDRFYNSLDPKMRVYVSSCYNKHHSLSREETGDFLDQFEVEV